MNEMEPIEVEVQDGVTFIRIGSRYGNFDDTALEELRQELFKILDDAPQPLVCVDFSRAQYFGSAFMGVLFRLWKRVTSRDGGKYAICSLTNDGASIIHAARLEQIWHVCETREDVVTLFSDRAKTN